MSVPRPHPQRHLPQRCTQFSYVTGTKVQILTCLATTRSGSTRSAAANAPAAPVFSTYSEEAIQKMIAFMSPPKLLGKGGCGKV